MENFGKCCYVILVLIISAIIGGLIFCKVWEYSMTAIFHLQLITVPQSIIFILLIEYLKGTTKKEIKEENSSINVIKEITIKFFESLCYSLTLLGIIYITYLFL